MYKRVIDTFEVYKIIENTKEQVISEIKDWHKNLDSSMMSVRVMQENILNVLNSVEKIVIKNSRKGER